MPPQYWALVGTAWNIYRFILSSSWAAPPRFLLPSLPCYQVRGPWLNLAMLWFQHRWQRKCMRVTKGTGTALQVSYLPTSEFSDRSEKNIMQFFVCWVDYFTTSMNKKSALKIMLLPPCRKWHMAHLELLRTTKFNAILSENKTLSCMVLAETHFCFWRTVQVGSEAK